MTAQFCGECGAQRGTPEQRFCVGCGQPYDDAAVPPHAHPASAAPTMAVPPAGSAAPSQAWTPPPATPATPAWTPAPEYAVPTTLASAPRKGRAGKVVGIGALVLAVAGAGFVGWQVFGADDGGADSPQVAAETFLTAVADQDAVGMLSMVNPGEVEGLDEVYETARERLEEEGFITGDAISDAVDVEFEGLEFDVDELGDQVVRVTLTDGTVTASYDPSGLPDRLDFVADEFPDGESESVDISRELRDLDLDLGLTVVEVDDRWYVSLLGTYADLIYQDYARYDDVARPDYDAVASAGDPVVGETPEDVVANVVASINDGDVSGFLDQLPADLAVGLRPYARPIERALDENGLRAEVTTDDLQLDVEDLGDGLVKVTIDEARFSARGYSYDEFEASGELAVFDACVETTDDDGYDDGYDDTYVDTECVPDNLLDDLGIKAPYLLMREVDGGYQLDPAATITSYATTVIESFPAEVVDELVSAIENDDDDYFECRYSDYCDE